MFTTKQKRDAKRCFDTVNSCKTVGQLNTAMNMIHNYGKMYGFNGYWTKLDIIGIELFKVHMDKLDYEERLASVQENANNP